MNREILGAFIVLMMGIGTVAAATLSEMPEEEKKIRPVRLVFLAGIAIGRTPSPNSITNEVDPECVKHIHRVRVEVGIYNHGTMARGRFSVDRCMYRVVARKTSDGTWYARLKNEDGQGRATLKWSEENNRFEGYLYVHGHGHRLFLRKVGPPVAEIEAIEE